MRLGYLAVFSCAFALSQSFSGITASDIGPHSAHIVGTVSQDGWVQVNLGTTSGGPYTAYSSASYCTNSPEIMFSGGGGSGAVAYLAVLSNTGVPSFPEVIYSGTGYTSAPSVSMVDRCISSYSITGGSWSGGTATVKATGDGGGSFYVGETITISGVTPSGYNASNVVVTAVDGEPGFGNISYALASNPGPWVSGGLITAAPGSGATLTATVSGGSVTGVTVSGGSGYHGQNYNNSFNQNVTAAPATHHVIVSIGGLAPATTYYGVITYRPDQNDSNGLVTSSQFTFTTPPACAGPCLPTLPQVTYSPASPANHPSFTTGYTVIPIAFNSAKHECAATNAVGPITYGGSAPGPGSSWSVGAGDTIQTILSEVGYGAILDIAQGSQCLIPTGYNACSNSTINYQGFYTMCVKNIDPQASSIDDPAHRFIVIRTHQSAAADFPPEGFRTGPQWASKLASFVSQAADPNGTGTGPSNGEGISADTASTSFTVPVHHYWLENIEWSTNASGSHGVAITLGSNNNPFVAAYPPQYLVLDRLYIKGPTRTNFSIFTNATSMTTGISGSPGGHTAITNSYIGAMDNGQEVSQGIYFSDCGAGPLTISNNFIEAFGQGIYIESNGVPYCGPVPTSSLTSIPTRSYDDVTITHNSLYWPLSSLPGNAAWDGMSRVSPRNQIESKIGRRWLIQGNLINGQWAGQTEGEVIAMSPTTSTTFNGESGSMDWTINFNLLTRAALIATFSGTRTLSNPGPPDPSITARALVSNNYAYNIGRNLYTLSGSVCSFMPCGAGAGPGYFSSANAAQDLTFVNNTWPYANGDGGSVFASYFPTWWLLEGPPMMAGLTWKSNILSLDGGGVAPAAIFASGDPGCCMQFPPFPNINTSSTSTIFATGFINVGTGGTVQNAYNWGQNIVVPGWYGSAETPWTQMTDTQAATFAATNPAGDEYITASTQTLAAHLAAAGIPGRDSGNPSCTATKQNPCAAGVNLQGLESALGIVSNIAVRSGPNALEFTYTAPDAQACSVDTSPDGATWTRKTDSGGSRNRSVLVSGLIASTTYQYMIECYYSQTAAWFAAPWDSSNLVTDGVSATTAGSGTRTLPISFALPRGASAAQFKLTGVGGSAIMQTCSNSPCLVPGVPNGSVLLQIAYLSSGGSTISNGSTWMQ